MEHSNEDLQRSLSKVACSINAASQSFIIQPKAGFIYDLNGIFCPILDSIQCVLYQNSNASQAPLYTEPYLVHSSDHKQSDFKFALCKPYFVATPTNITNTKKQALKRSPSWSVAPN